MIGISHIPCSKLPWQPELTSNNSFVLSRIEFIFGMVLAWDNHISCCYGNSVTMATRVKHQ